MVQALRFALPIALLLTLFGVNLFHDSSAVDDVFGGPVEHVLVWATAKGALAERLYLFFIYGLSLTTLLLIVRQLIQQFQTNLFTDKTLIFSVAFVGMFMAAQAFVGGNHPFFDRYLVHPWPFIGYMFASLYPNFFNNRTYLVMGFYTIFSVMVLVKWGIM